MAFIPDFGSFAGGGTFDPTSKGGGFDGFSAAGGLLGGVGSIFAGIEGSKASKASATEYGYAAQFTKTMAGIEQTAATRQLTQVQGAAKAAIGGNGFTLGGSAGDILRSNAQQGALTKGVISQQAGAQEQAYLQQQKAAKSAASGDMIGGILKGVGEIAGVVAAPFTGGASLALTTALAASG